MQAWQHGLFPRLRATARWPPVRRLRVRLLETAGYCLALDFFPIQVSDEHCPQYAVCCPSQERALMWVTRRHHLSWRSSRVQARLRHLRPSKGGPIQLACGLISRDIAFGSGQTPHEALREFDVVLGKLPSELAPPPARQSAHLLHAQPSCDSRGRPPTHRCLDHRRVSSCDPLTLPAHARPPVVPRLYNLRSHPGWTRVLTGCLPGDSLGSRSYLAPCSQPSARQPTRACDSVHRGAWRTRL
jgi:hypothetical protein